MRTGLSITSGSSIPYFPVCRTIVMTRCPAVSTASPSCQWMTRGDLQIWFRMQGRLPHNPERRDIITMSEMIPVSCAVCSTTSSQPTGTEISGPKEYDLDLRPRTLTGDPVPDTIQCCPSCGYCARDIGAEITSEVREFVRGPAYRSRLTDPALPSSACRYLCSGLIAEYEMHLPRSVRSVLHAAWICDDLHEVVGSVRCRMVAAEQIISAGSCGIRVWRDPGLDELVLSDLFRRAGAFEKAAAVVSSAINPGVSPEIAEALLFENALITHWDTFPYGFSEVLNSEKNEKEKKHV